MPRLDRQTHHYSNNTETQNMSDPKTTEEKLQPLRIELERAKNELKTSILENKSAAEIENNRLAVDALQELIELCQSMHQRTLQFE